MLIALVASLLSIPFDIYFWIKWVAAYIAIRFYNATHGKRFDVYKPDARGDPVKLGFLVPQIEKDLESPQPEAHLQEAADEVCFYGVNSKSECVLVRVTRGGNQEAEAWIYLKLANGKTYHLADHVNYQQSYDENCTTYSSGNLQMHYLTPMRRWRIHYCGPLTEKSENKETPERVKFVNFVFLWAASSDVFDVNLDHNSSSVISSLAAADWNNVFQPPVKELSEAINIYLQVGNVRGTVSVEDEQDYEMNLFGEKIRSLGKLSNIAGCNFECLVGYVPMTGFGFHALDISAPKLCKNLPCGFVIKPSGDLSRIKELDITIKPFSIVKENREFAAKITADALYEINGIIHAEPIVLYSGQGWNGFAEVSFVSFKASDKTGYGLLLSGEIYSDSKNEFKETTRLPFPKTVPHTVKFTDEISQFGDITGGKGSSLGKLTQLSRTNKAFTVPKGIVVTTSAFDTFLTQDILISIRLLENVTYGNIEGDIKDACGLVAKNILNTALPNKISQSIINDLKSVFGEDFKNRKYAVRSSATGEDTDAMSAAGQMDTYLGVQGLQEIFLSIKKCWASQFGHIAVEYKRQNGQPLNSPMAVVVQEMVACEVSGVLFTCDPVNNNPNVITITANYGLGETVVSGTVEPDTIMFERSASESLKIKSINIGSKHQRIIMKEDGGTVEEDLGEESKNEACISTETAETLAKLSIEVEKFYRSSRDIEWGIKNNQVYLLQSRPVTSGGTITDFEIKHEFDSVVRSERDYFTVANVGEVMPDAISPLGLQVTSKYFSSAVGEDAYKRGIEDAFSKSKYYEAAFHSFYGHAVMSIPEIACRYGHDTMFSKGMMISIFGRILEEPEIYEVAREKIPDSPPPTFWSDFMFIKDLLFYDKNIDRVRKKIFNYDFPYLKCKTSQETFDALTKSCSDFNEAMVNHWRCTENSSHWNVIIFLILHRAKGRFDTDVYSDFGRILATSTNLESADIPSSLQFLANKISDDLGAEKFKAMDIEDAEKWLETSKTEASKQYHLFIERHGHRCLKEFDVYSTPWEQDRQNLVKLLQTMVGFTKESTEKSEEDNSKLFAELRVPLNWINRLFLRFAIPNTRKGVRNREFSKSILIKSMHNWRKGYQHLADLMVKEGRIPDKKLIYFMTIDELQTLLQTRNPKIIARANSRRKLFPVLEEYKFPEIMRGFPKPMNEENEDDIIEYSSDLTMQGIPVSQGVTKGFARVAVSLEQAALLKPGEILIAYSTDIGWSPYFPIISGVVTELGGLISHGAVVSREYGLPCVVGLRGATKQFRTGDYVLLDGKKGLLQRLPPPPTSN